MPRLLQLLLVLALSYAEEAAAQKQPATKTSKSANLREVKKPVGVQGREAAAKKPGATSNQSPLDRQGEAEVLVTIHKSHYSSGGGQSRTAVNLIDVSR